MHRLIERQVIFKSKLRNIAELLITKGLAHLIRHRKDDHDRSSFYDELVLAEDRAVKAKKGIFSDKEPTHRFVDVSENVAKANSFLQFFKRQKRLDCVVEYVSNCARYRLLVPSENCRMTFVISGITCPRSGKDGNSSEPFAEESCALAKHLLLQRDVKVEVENIDKQGGFLGAMFINLEGKEINVACHFLSKGFASIFSTSNSYAQDMLSCEQAAQKSRLGVFYC